MEFINQMEPSVGDEEAKAMNAYLLSGAWLTEFKRTTEFEQMIAQYTGSRYCCVVANGTVSLAIALWAAGIGSGDEVLVPNYTMIASPNAVRLVGAKPVLVDVEPATLCMDLNLAAKHVTSRTKALMLVTLNGRSPDMSSFQDFCQKHSLFFLEDAAQSLGSFKSGKHLGTFGNAGSFSFSAPKIITTGQGGALVTDDAGLNDRFRKIKDFGRTKGGIDWHECMGYNFKFSDLQAIIGIEQMKKLSGRVSKKKEMCQWYTNGLRHIPEVEMLSQPPEAVLWFFDIYVDKREDLMQFLREKGIGSRPAYPPISHQEIYRNGQLYPVSENYCYKGLWLPSSSFLNQEHIQRVVDAIKEFYEG